MTPELAHVCDIAVDVGPIRDLGAVPHGRRRIIQITGGTVRGPRLVADILPGGADWQYLRADGVLELVARYSILARDGVEIAITNRGLRRASPEKPWGSDSAVSHLDAHVRTREDRSGEADEGRQRHQEDVERVDEELLTSDQQGTLTYHLRREHAGGQECDEADAHIQIGSPASRAI